MAIENELMNECFTKNLRMGTARTKEHKDTDEEGKHKIVNMEHSKLRTK